MQGLKLNHVSKRGHRCLSVQRRDDRGNVDHFFLTGSVANPHHVQIHFMKNFYSSKLNSSQVAYKWISTMNYTLLCWEVKCNLTCLEQLIADCDTTSWPLGDTDAILIIPNSCQRRVTWTSAVTAPQENAACTRRWFVHIGWSNALERSDTEPLLEPKLYQIYVAMWLN